MSEYVGHRLQCPLMTGRRTRGIFRVQSTAPLTPGWGQEPAEVPQRGLYALEWPRLGARAGLSEHKGPCPGVGDPGVTLWEKPLISTLLRASSHMSQELSFHTCVAMLYSSIRGSCNGTAASDWPRLPPEHPLSPSLPAAGQESGVGC